MFKVTHDRDRRCRFGQFTPPAPEIEPPLTSGQNVRIDRIQRPQSLEIWRISAGPFSNRDIEGQKNTFNASSLKICSRLTFFLVTQTLPMLWQCLREKVLADFEICYIAHGGGARSLQCHSVSHKIGLSKLSVPTSL